MTGLARAAKTGGIEDLETAISSGVNIADLTDEWGWPLVHVAALHGRTAVARLLWESEARKDRGRLRRALYLSLQSGNKETIQYFLDQGAASSEVLKKLYLSDVEGLRSVLETDPAQANIKDEDGQTPLHVAANMDLREAAEVLIAHGADVEARNERGESPFFRSISNGAESVARLLLRHGADVNTVTSYGQNALHCAPTTHRKPLVKLLESRGIDREFEDIHVSSALGRLDRVKALLAEAPGLQDKQDVLGPLRYIGASLTRNTRSLSICSNGVPTEHQGDARPNSYALRHPTKRQRDDQASRCTWSCDFVMLRTQCAPSRARR